MRNSSGIYSISEVPSFVKGFRKMTDQDFDPRTPCGVRLFPVKQAVTVAAFQSTHPMRGATLDLCLSGLISQISIHAPHAGCDTCAQKYTYTGFAFQSTHPMRGATPFRRTSTAVFPFQSTHPMRGATSSSFCPCRYTRYFNPRTPCGVRHAFFDGDELLVFISIHAPHAGCDLVAT